MKRAAAILDFAGGKHPLLAEEEECFCWTTL